ncbi:MAG TPA: penicillin-binding protein activator LpoB [Cyclobacteriaceae bacterium]|nr:penicillin-binding protein activator LpoB [Cyclobacteriaceae bacterium]
MKTVFLMLVGSVLLLGCARSVSCIDPGTSIDLSGRWNDTDSRAVAEKMTQDLLASNSFKAYAKDKGKKPAIIVGWVLNKTSEHIDAQNFIKKIELTIFNSGIADLVESDTFRDKLREERAQQQDFSSSGTAAQWGLEAGADLMLFGEMTSETDVHHNKRVVNYIVTLFLTDMETNKRVWYGQKEIKKFIKN